MKNKIIALLRHFANWLEGPQAVSIAQESPALARARALVLAAEQLVGVSGEYKRHVVYAQLIKEFPNEAKRFLALQIELALN